MTQQELDALLRKNKGLTVEMRAFTSQASVGLIPYHREEEPLISKPEAKEGHSGVSFTIWGQPMGKPRMTQRDKWAKRPCVIKYWAWADKARASVPRGTNLSKCREISFVAYLEIPKSTSKKKGFQMMRAPHLQKPDIDNLGKGILDALFKDDSKIWKLSSEKRWDDGRGARVEVVLG